MKKINILLFISLIIAVVIACSTSTDDEPTGNDFSVTQLLSDTTTEVILPILEDFNSQAKLFDAAVTTYLTETSEANLAALKTQWSATAISYEKTYVFHIGIARDRFLHQAIYNWPTVSNALEDFILNNEVTRTTVAAISPQIKALAGLEYLVFKTDVTTTNNEFRAEEKRREYLKLSSAFLVSQSDRLLDIWSIDGEDYANNFINSTETGIDGSFNLLFNGLYNAIDTGKVTKIGKPAGLENSDIVLPELVQAPYSNQSLNLLLSTIETVEIAFFNPDITNISHYIGSITGDDVLNNDIQTAIDAVKIAITAIPVSLEEAVSTNPTEVETLHTKLTELNVLLAVDVRSILSIIVTSTDNDGD